MGKLKEWAIERERERAQSRKGRRRAPVPRKNSPLEFREGALREEILACLRSGLTYKEAEERVVAWNSAQAAPLAFGKVKQEVYLAYVGAATEANS